MRREFSKQVKRAAFERAKGYCEGMPYGQPCGTKLMLGKYHYDHEIPDALGGEPVIENCKVLCVACHADKTGKKDIPAIAKTKRIQDRQKGIKSYSKFACSRDKKWKKKIDGSVVLR